MSLFDMEAIPYPFIVHVQKKAKLPHYYVIYKNTKKGLLVGDPDPSVKITKISKETFATGLRKTVQWYLNNNEWISHVQNGEYQNWIIKQYEK